MFTNTGWTLQLTPILQNYFFLYLKRCLQLCWIALVLDAFTFMWKCETDFRGSFLVQLKPYPIHASSSTKTTIYPTGQGVTDSRLPHKLWLQLSQLRPRSAMLHSAATTDVNSQSRNEPVFATQPSQGTRSAHRQWWRSKFPRSRLTDRTVSEVPCQMWIPYLPSVAKTSLHGAQNSNSNTVITFSGFRFSVEV